MGVVDDMGEKKEIISLEEDLKRLQKEQESGGRKDIVVNEKGRIVLYYIANRFIPRKDIAGKTVYFKIPTAIFAVSKEEAASIQYPLDVYALHNDNLWILQQKATELNITIDEWDWDKTILRPTIPSSYLSGEM